MKDAQAKSGALPSPDHGKPAGEPANANKPSEAGRQAERNAQALELPDPIRPANDRNTRGVRYSGYCGDAHR